MQVVLVFLLSIASLIIYFIDSSTYVFIYAFVFLDPEGGSQKATLVVLLLVVGISSPLSKNP